MNEKEQITLLIKNSEHAFKDLEWNEKDIEIGMTWLTYIILALTTSHFNFPIHDKRFYEVLRVVANLLEANEDLMKKSDRW